VGRIHPATRTFQALRIAVNRELEVLEAGLDAALAVLRPGGRLAVIAYHSLEDRIVKRFLAREARDCLEEPLPPVCTCGHKAQVRLVSRRVIRPTEAEVARNRRARSARLRVAERTGGLGT
jgi:16S rRNA (cytosine1402-N4)-methyltransferase